MMSVEIVPATGRGGKIMSDSADNADAERSRRLRIVPRHLRTIASLVDHAHCPSVRRGRRSARAIIMLAIVCAIAALIVAYPSWYEEVRDPSPRPALGRPARALQPSQPTPVEPLSSAESHDFSLAAKARWPAPGAEARELVQLLAKFAALVRPLHVGIFNERSCCDEPEPLFHILDAIPSCTHELLSAENIQSRPDRLARFDVLIFPGGRAHKQAAALGENARGAVKDFIRSGGGYVGICAGGFLASAQYEWSLGLVNTRTLTGDQEIPGVGMRSMADRGPATVQIELTEEGQAIFGARANPMNISFSGGPIFLGPKRDDLPLTIPLAHYNSDVSTYVAQRGTMIGTPAIFAAKFGAGRVVAISPHPESTADAKFLVRAAVLATARTRASTGPEPRAGEVPVP
jgi:glutamine amidotransferase-like uncharacterized protein